jgi:hypothetical protein
MSINHEGNDLLLLVSTCERSIIIIVVIDVSHCSLSTVLFLDYLLTLVLREQ